VHEPAAPRPRPAAVLVEMGARLHAIREACKLDPDMRTEENINDIIDVVKDVKFFSRLTTLQQRTLCRTMTIEEFGPREFVFQMGENGDKFYIILTGSVGVQVPSQTAPCPNDVHSEKCDCPNRPLETVVFLEKGMGFGELALQSDQPRSATIQTSEKTELLVTKRTDYEMYAGQLHRQFIEQRVKFLRQCPRIEDALQRCLVSTQDIAAMANCLNEANLSGNAVACRQGDVVDHMIFVRSGSLATLRCVDLEQHVASRTGATGAPKALSQRNTRTNRSTMSSPAAPPEDAASNKTTSDTDAQQPQSQLTTNLAKAMMEMKARDRKAKLSHIAHMEEDDAFGEHDVFGGSGLDVGGEAASALSRSVEFESEQPKPNSALLTTVSARVQAQRGSAPKTRESSVRFGKSRGSGDEGKNKGQPSALWKRLQASVKMATALDKFVGGNAKSSDEDSGADGIEAAHRNVEHFASVQAARRKVTEYTFNKMHNSDRPKKKSISTRLQKRHRPSWKSDVRGESGTSGRRVRLLRIGTIGPYQYFGDQQVCNNECYPVSLVSDPVAEIYVMSKHDILRRVPKKLFSALFTPEKEAVPSDVQLLEMHRQTERWNAFRRSMHGEALSNLGLRNQVCGVPRPLRDPASASRIDAVANLEFLGVNPASGLGESLLPLPQNKGVPLTPKDEELFSQASARFLRRFDIMKRDKGLREALARAGLMRRQRLHDGLPGSALDDDDQDPMAFRFDQHWSKLREDPIGLDLDDVLSDDSAKVPQAPPGPPPATTPSRTSMKARRISVPDNSNKRTSTAALGTAASSSASASSDKSLLVHDMVPGSASTTCGNSSFLNTASTITEPAQSSPPGTARASYSGSTAPPSSAPQARRKSLKMQGDRSDSSGVSGSAPFELPPVTTDASSNPRSAQPPTTAPSGGGQRRQVAFSSD